MKSYTKTKEKTIRERIKKEKELLLCQLRIKDKNMTAIIFWLKHHHPAYETRIELRQAVSTSDENLTQKQKAIIKEALAHTMIGQIPEICRKEDKDGKEIK